MSGIQTTPPFAAREARRRPGARWRWLLAWAGERFPARNAAFFALLYATALLVARTGVAPRAVGWRDVPGFLALWAFFLLLRVFDEHKDFAADAVAHPGRVLQRGLVTLGQLKLIGAAAVLLQLGVSVWHDRGIGAATAWWLAALAWSLLMAREFFAPRWLRARLVLYALSHMLVMPLLVLWVMAMASPAAVGAATAAALAPVALTAALAFAAGLAVEVARKVRAPADERPMADSYTGALGIGGAMRLLVGATLAAALLAEWLLVRLAGGAPPALASAAVGAGCAVALWAAASFARAPTGANAKRVEVAAGVAVLLAHVAVVGVLLALPSAGRG